MKKNILKAIFKNRKILIFIIIIFLILSFIFGSIILKKIGTSYYENKMEKYGLAKKYNNGTANSKDNITKSEAVKMIIEMGLNGTDISNVTVKYGDELYSNYTWVNYAYGIHIVDNDFIINTENENEDITVFDMIKILYNYKSNIATSDEKVEVVDKKIKIKNSKDYSDNELEKINYLISYGVIPNNYKYGKDTILTKKYFNQIIAYYYENNRN